MARQVNPLWQKIGSELRKRRRAASLSQDRVAAEVRVSSSLVSYWEKGTRTPQLDHCKELDALFKTSGVFQRLWTRDNNSHGMYPEGIQGGIDLERTARELREFHGTLVPGLAQTPRYARAIFQAMRPWVDSTTLDGMVELRMKRQEILKSPDRPLLSIVLDETVIRRVLGDVSIAKEQLEHLLRLADDGIIRLQVMPQDLLLPPGLSGPFRVFVFSDRPVAVSVEHMLDDLILDDADQIRECVMMFGVIQAEALSTKASYDLVRKVQGELG
ncbi:Scr1 family TA system antitoxin-like transcriptional regulator [Nocardiopsis sediminis]|uniref:Scr1 family TA system antitoxin-like transcriptional regulator n=1 Tax=Nocardiopsis sediminis TaxID=1778267 RepID=A0ABV8FFK7_9ACTN